MSFEITFLDAVPIQRRYKDGMLADVTDYPFRVSKGQSSRTVMVGIPGQFNALAAPLGYKRLSSGELVEAACAWLRSRIDRGDCDPFSRPETDSMIDLPLAIMDYWVEHRSIPPWL